MKRFVNILVFFSSTLIPSSAAAKSIGDTLLRAEIQESSWQACWPLVVIVLCVIIVLLTAGLVVTGMKLVKKGHQLAEERGRMEEAIKIKDAALTDASAPKIDDNTLDKAVKALVCERLGLLNKFIASRMIPNFSVDVVAELNQFMQDKNYFIESTRISFSLEHSEFVGYLMKRGLSDGEIGYCCLYAMGLKGKDIAAYMGNGHYKRSCAVRKKLGLNEHDTNLDIYLRKKFEEMVK